MRRIKDIAHILWGHDWTPWETWKRDRDSDFGTPLVYQRRTCKICGKVDGRYQYDA